FKARFQSLSRKDGDQKIICDGRVITLISPSDFKNVLMYVVVFSRIVEYNITRKSPRKSMCNSIL